MISVLEESQIMAALSSTSVFAIEYLEANLSLEMQRRKEEEQERKEFARFKREIYAIFADPNKKKPKKRRKNNKLRKAVPIKTEVGIEKTETFELKNEELVDIEDNFNESDPVTKLLEVINLDHSYHNNKMPNLIKTQVKSEEGSQHLEQEDSEMCFKIAKCAELKNWSRDVRKELQFISSRIIIFNEIYVPENSIMIKEEFIDNLETDTDLHVPMDEGYGTGESEPTEFHRSNENFSDSVDLIDFKGFKGFEVDQLDSVEKPLPEKYAQVVPICDLEIKHRTSDKPKILGEENVKNLNIPLRRSQRKRKPVVRFGYEDEIEIKANNKKNTSVVPKQIKIEKNLDTSLTMSDRLDQLGLDLRDLGISDLATPQSKHSEYQCLCQAKLIDPKLQAELDEVDYLINHWEYIRLEFNQSCDFRINEFDFETYLGY